MTNFHKDVEQIRTAILQKLNHPYLVRFIDLPSIDEDKLVMLYAILQEADIEQDKIKHYVETTMLVQLALDAHEMVSLSHIHDDETVLKSRQLTVLAGDYYSGLYYHLLAQIEDISMIKLLAGAIKKINEEKIAIYQGNPTFHDLIVKVKNIESLLLQKVADFVQLPGLKKTIEHVCLLKRLTNEKQLFFQMGGSRLFHVLEHEGGRDVNKDGLMDTYDSYIRKTQEAIEKLTDTSLYKDNLLFDHIGKIMKATSLDKQKVAEEG